MLRDDNKKYAMFSMSVKKKEHSLIQNYVHLQHFIFELQWHRIANLFIPHVNSSVGVFVCVICVCSKLLWGWSHSLDKCVMTVYVSRCVVEVNVCIYVCDCAYEASGSTQMYVCAWLLVPIHLIVWRHIEQCEIWCDEWLSFLTY